MFTQQTQIPIIIISIIRMQREQGINYYRFYMNKNIFINLCMQHFKHNECIEIRGLISSTQTNKEKNKIKLNRINILIKLNILLSLSKIIGSNMMIIIIIII